MKKQLFSGAALVALVIPGVAFAQSTGTIDAEETIVVTGSRNTTGILGVKVPDTPKAQTVLDNQVLRQAAPGQSVLQVINVVPSVNFTNNDAFGSSGGNVRIRGFDGNRVSLTFDGLPLNDTGNYAIFSNQQLDPEIIGSVNVNQGTTDVDSPTAASSGGTINYRTILPQENYGGMVVGSYGETPGGRRFYRFFGKLETGDIFGTGVRGFISASSARNDKFRGSGDIYKQQYNARLYKAFANGDFVSLGGHYNQNRNNSYRSITLAQAALDIRTNGRFKFDNNPFCARPTFGPGPQSEAATPQPSTVIPSNQGVTFNAPAPSGLDTSCTNYYGVRINPSNTGNVRYNSKFSITDALTFTLDGGYQYTLANGGGFTSQASATADNSTGESSLRVKAFNAAGPGVDFSGDGDTADTLAFYTPNNTRTHRFTVLSSLRYDFSDTQSLRIAYAFDKGRHRQTGQYGFLDAVGNPQNVFGGRYGVGPRDANGYQLRTRDRFSIAELNQVSGEYRGNFFDSLEIVLGVRAPFFKRNLNQYCYTIVSTSNPLCTSATLGTTAIPTTAGYFVVPNNVTVAGLPTNAVYAPFQTTYKYDKLLPNLGFTFRPMDQVQVFGAYAKGLSVPRTDNLYRAPRVNVTPETSSNFDLGVRYSSATIQASFGGFYNRFKNRIQQTTDNDTSSPTFGLSIDRNVGTVEIKGLEATLNVQPFPWLSFRGYGSYLDAKYQDNLFVSSTLTLPIAGKRLVETPKWQYGYRAQVNYGPATLGLDFKQRTSRAATDLNDLIVPGYSTFNIDARFSLADYGLSKTFIQVNVDNLFNTQYLGSISSTQSLTQNFAGLVPGLATTAALSGGSNPFFQPGAPRAVVVSLQVGF